MKAKDAVEYVRGIPENEEVFVLRAQDLLAPGTVLHWCTQYQHFKQDDKLREARQCAYRMMAHGMTKIPD